MPPEQSGTYVLVLHLPHMVTVDVGRLGRFQFPAGWYAYAGSAHGPGGLASRTSRHLRSVKPLHWHVDYLRAHAGPIEIWYATGAQKRECAWARALVDLPGASVPAPGFGASDCRCSTHLVHFAALPDFESFAHAAEGHILREAPNV